MKNLLFVTLLFSAPVFAENPVYQWVDRDGALHFSNAEGAGEQHGAATKLEEAPVTVIHSDLPADGGAGWSGGGPSGGDDPERLPDPQADNGPPLPPGQSGPSWGIDYSDDYSDSTPAGFPYGGGYGHRYNGGHPRPFRPQVGSSSAHRGTATWSGGSGTPAGGPTPRSSGTGAGPRTGVAGASGGGSAGGHAGGGPGAASGHAGGGSGGTPRGGAGARPRTAH